MQGETVTVDFPEQEGWIGEVSEMDLVVSADLGIIDSYSCYFVVYYFSNSSVLNVCHSIQFTLCTWSI